MVARQPQHVLGILATISNFCRFWVGKLEAKPPPLPTPRGIGGWQALCACVRVCVL